MPRCFVIQPFDSGKFDKRFKETFAPAIRAAGLEAYRVDQDVNVDILVNSIEDEIRSAAVCLADITTDNPNVWYELGFAFAARRPVVLVCSNERQSFPFDIQHRAVITYKTEAQSDFENLSTAITERLRSAADRSTALEDLAQTGQVAEVSGLSQIKMMLLAVAAGMTESPGSAFALWDLRNDAEKAGLSKVGVSLAMRRLTRRRFLAEATFDDERGNQYRGAIISSEAWDWIDANERSFTLRLAPRGNRTYVTAEISDDDLPF